MVFLRRNSNGSKFPVDGVPEKITKKVR